MDAVALVVGKRGRWGFLNELLEAALRGAIAGAQNGDVAVGIGQNLSLHVARVGQELLHVAFCAAEGLLGLAASGVEGCLDVLEILHHLEAAAATTVGSLNGDGQAVLLSEGAGFLPVIDGIGGTWGQRGTDLLSHASRSNFVTEQLDGLRRWANPRQASLGHGAGKISVL